MRLRSLLSCTSLTIALVMQAGAVAHASEVEPSGGTARLAAGHNSGGTVVVSAAAPAATETRPGDLVFSTADGRITGLTKVFPIHTSVEM